MTAGTAVGPAPQLPGRPKKPWTRRVKLWICAAAALLLGLGLLFAPQFEPPEKKEKIPENQGRGITRQFSMAPDDKPADKSAEKWPEPDPDAVKFRVPDKLTTGSTSNSNSNATSIFAIKSVGSGSGDPVRPASVRKPAGDDDDADTEVRGSSKRSNDGMVKATIVQDQHYVIPGDIYIGCTLYGATDSQLHGPIRCHTAERVMSEDGEIELLPKGTTVKGTIEQDVRRGQNRVGFRWTRMRTPEGVRVRINAPATDDLGRVGVPGEINHHFIDRYGAALMFTALNAIPQIASAALQNNNGGGNYFNLYQGGAGQQVVGQILQETMNIPPTIQINEGVTIKIALDEDLDFSNVYRLRMARHAR